MRQADVKCIVLESRYFLTSGNMATRPEAQPPVHSRWWHASIGCWDTSCQESLKLTTSNKFTYRLPACAVPPSTTADRVTGFSPVSPVFCHQLSPFSLFFMPCSQVWDGRRRAVSPTCRLILRVFQKPHEHPGAGQSLMRDPVSADLRHRAASHPFSTASLRWLAHAFSTPSINLVQS